MLGESPYAYEMNYYIIMYSFFLRIIAFFSRIIYGFVFMYAIYQEMYCTSSQRGFKNIK